MTKEEELKRFGRTTYYQTVVFQKLEDIIIDKQFKLIRACNDIGEQWKDVKRFLSTQQKEKLNLLIKKYGKNGGRKLRRVATRLTKET